ncbi:hypothetical protein HPP92_026503 [Vanilla planifolia]|uniref:Uncharacterized protein n=1 Tax=Vanilla planifolia TaxID=51239 RepID=A0A835PGB7_VANPL|nr:hypothetical protein HPP92_026503 [Vanilla planifolia]
MSITLERVDGPIPSFRACDSTEQDDAAPAVTSSSIGRNSDCSTAGGGTGEELGEAEVQSSFKGPLETMDALEDSLPIRRGISKFYCGKSKSFASLSDAISNLSSAKELGKPENAYSRKRKNLLALSCMWEVPENDSISGFSAAKRHANSSCRIAGDTGVKNDQFQLLPPLNAIACQNASPWASPSPETERISFPPRSYSLVDLQRMECLSSSSSSSSSIAS